MPFQKAAMRKQTDHPASSAHSLIVSNGRSRVLKRKSEEPTSKPNPKARKLDPGPEKVLSAPGRKAPSQRARKAKGEKAKAVLSQALDKPLNVYVFGVNDQGELGLGAGTPPGHVGRPRFNPNLSPESAGVIQIATGGMHCAALTRDNRILTWGINDLGALGRDTEWSGGWVDMDEKKSDADSDDSETAVNPKEATPTAVDTALFPPGTKFTQLAAGDNATFALTSDGLVYGWGTFKVIAST